MMRIVLKWKLQKLVVEMTAKWSMSAVLQLVMNIQVVILTEI